MPSRTARAAETLYSTPSRGLVRRLSRRRSAAARQGRLSSIRSTSMSPSAGGKPSPVKLRHSPSPAKRSRRSRTVAGTPCSNQRFPVITKTSQKCCNKQTTSLSDLRRQISVRKAIYQKLAYSAASGDTRAAVEWNKLRTRFVSEYVDEQLSLLAQVIESDKLARHCPEDVTDKFLETLKHLKSMLGPGYAYW